MVGKGDIPLSLSLFSIVSSASALAKVSGVGGELTFLVNFPCKLPRVWGIQYLESMSTVEEERHASSTASSGRGAAMTEVALKTTRAARKS